MFFGPDGKLMSVKWKIYKTIFRYSEGVDKPIVQPQFPMFYDLSSDPHEDWNLFDTELTNGWIMAPNYKAILEFAVRLLTQVRGCGITAERMRLLRPCSDNDLIAETVPPGKIIIEADIRREFSGRYCKDRPPRK